MRQAEEAVRLDRLEEALELAGQPEVADHRRAMRLRARIAARLADRAGEQMRLGLSQAARRDLRLAEMAGAPAAKLAGVRGEFMKHGMAEAQAYLDAGNPRQARTVAEQLRHRGTDSLELRQLSEAAAWWERGEEAARVGEFSLAIRSLETAVKHLGSHAALEKRLNTLRSDAQRTTELRERIRSALAAQDWPGVLHAAESLMELAGTCREAVNARDEAWRRLGIPATAVAGPRLGRAPAVAQQAALNGAVGDAGMSARERCILWIDGVGGYLVCSGCIVTMGQAGPENAVDVPILGDLSRQHAILVRDDEGYLIRSDRGMSVNGQPVRQSPLRHGDVILLGRSVELRFSTPCPVSDTARMELTSGHRLQLSLSGILLMAETCVLGPSAQANVQVPTGSQVVLYRQGDALWCRTEGTVEIDGQAYENRGPVRLSSRVTVGDLSFSLEPLSSKLNPM